MIYVIIFFAALLALFVLCGYECDNQRRRDPDADCCRGLLMVLLVAVLIWAGGQPAKPVKVNPMFISFWNRSGRTAKRGHWQVYDYRKPDHNLPPAEYMMGVELAKTNACSSFLMNIDSEVDRFKRCTHFFPELRAEYQQKYEEQVGFCI
jgi:hypothetical protein